MLFLTYWIQENVNAWSDLSGIVIEMVREHSDLQLSLQLQQISLTQMFMLLISVAGLETGPGDFALKLILSLA